MKTFKSALVKNVETSQIKIQNIKKKTFKENEKNLINNVII